MLERFASMATRGAFSRGFRAIAAPASAGLIMLAPLAVPADARACGGCFHDPTPTGSPMVVDAHRMVLRVSPEGTVLWDQIVYEGAPTDFVWVLPVASAARVELAEEGFFDALTATTRITLRGPPPIRTFCPNPCGQDFGFFAAGAPRQVDAGVGPPVTVYSRGVIGPYETATIGSEDPRALLTWLDANGYAVDDSLLPTITHYVEQGLSFAVLRLRSDADIDRMQPVRVTFPGVSTTLPLRMVAAGVGIDLDIELFVFAESRMEVANFGNAEVDRAAITYDWSTDSFDYELRFDEALFAGDGPTTNWVTEYAQRVPSSVGLASWETALPDGTVSRARGDVAVASAGLGDGPYVTRLRTRLRPNDLREDLNLRASSAPDVGTFVQVTREVNRPWEPTCNTVCSSPNGLEPGGSVTRGAGSSYRCHATPGPAGRVPLAALLGLGALVIVVRRRRRTWHPPC